jgi:hypothetical protein
VSSKNVHIIGLDLLFLFENFKIILKQLKNNIYLQNETKEEMKFIQLHHHHTHTSTQVSW